MDELTLVWNLCVCFFFFFLYAYDIVLVDELVNNVERFFEYKGFWLSTNTKYTWCKLSKSINKDGGVVRLGGEKTPKGKWLRYLWSIIHKN